MIRALVIAGVSSGAYTVLTRGGETSPPEGYLIGNALMSYVHLHFESNPRVAEHLVASCRAGRNR